MPNIVVPIFMQGVLAATNAQQARQLLDAGMISVTTDAEKLALPNPSAGQLVHITGEGNRVEMFLSDQLGDFIAEGFSVINDSFAGVNGDYLYVSGYALVNGRRTYQQTIAGAAGSVLIYPVSGAGEAWAFRLSSEDASSPFYLGAEGQYPMHPSQVQNWLFRSATGGPYDSLLSGLSFSTISPMTTEMGWVDIMPTLQLYAENYLTENLTVNGVHATQGTITYIGWVRSNEPIKILPAQWPATIANVDGINFVSGTTLVLNSDTKSLLPLPSFAKFRSLTVKI